MDREKRGQCGTPLWHEPCVLTILFSAEEEWPTARPSLKAPVLRLTRGGYRKHPYGRYWRCSRHVTSDFKLFIYFLNPSWKKKKNVVTFALFFGFFNFNFVRLLSEIEIKNNPVKHINPQTLTLLQYSDFTRSLCFENMERKWKRGSHPGSPVYRKVVIKIGCL